MKTFNRTFLPDEITYKGKTFVCNYSVSAEMNLKNKSAATIEKEAKLITGAKTVVLVNVLSRNLKGREDLHGNLYKPTRWIFTPKS